MNIIMNLNLKNPFAFVKNTRQSYSRFYEKIFTEVQVQFDDEDPAWIPLDTLISMSEKYGEL